MRGCSTCAKFEQLLEKTADDHWSVVLRRSGELEPEQAAMVKQQLRATKAAMDEALEQYKHHLEAAHSRAASSAE
jgi:hypothetical protein